MKVLHIDRNHPILLEGLEKLGCTNEEDYASSKESIASKIHQYEGIVIRSRFKIDAAFLDKATRLKFIARVGAGLESIDLDYAAKKGVQLIAAPEGNRDAVGEHAVGSVARSVQQNQTGRHANSQWKVAPRSQPRRPTEWQNGGLDRLWEYGQSFCKKIARLRCRSSLL